MSTVICERPGCTAYDKMLRELAMRVSGVVAANESGRWPGAELVALLGCLRRQVLPEFVHHAAAPSARMSRDYARLTAAIAVLERIGAGEAGRSADQLTATARGVLSQVHRHLAAEHGLLGEANIS